MREAAFVRQNAERWKRFEGSLAEARTVDPDLLAEWFVQLTDDLAYARTYYPHSTTTRYLNQLTIAAHQAIYRNRGEDRSRVITFWTQELPLEILAARRELFYALCVFLIAIVIGLVSAAHDAGFVRLILGDSYVNMTLENIQKGDPLAVFKGGQVNMFLGITANNVRISFLAFVGGISLGIGTFWLLLTNGVMVGAIAWFFHDQGLTLDFILTIFIHGTLELSAIVLAGGAGLVMAGGILFPGTYTRRYAFMRGARRGMKIVIGLVPIFIVAATLESFVTRYNTVMPTALRAAIILVSLAFVIGYFVIYPFILGRRAAIGGPDTLST